MSHSATTRIDRLDSIGRALVVLGEYEQAERCWERSMATTHSPAAEPVGWYHLGESRWHQNNTDGARAAYQRATARGLEFHFARLAEARLLDRWDVWAAEE